MVLLVPASEQLRDYPLRIEEILNTLSIVERRPVAEVVRNIVTPTSDILHLRLESPDTRTGTLELRFVERFFSEDEGPARLRRMWSVRAQGRFILAP